MTEQNVPDNFTVGSNNLTVSRELLRQAIDVFERIDRWLEVRRGVGWTPQDVEIVIALRAALEQPMQEPVAWMDRDGDVYKELPTPYWCPPHTPLYAAPQAQQPQLLTDEIESLRKDAGRYRWLRKGNRLTVKCKSATVMFGPNPEKDYPDQLDAAIDAAMEGGK